MDTELQGNDELIEMQAPFFATSRISGAAAMEEMRQRLAELRFKVERIEVLDCAVRVIFASEAFLQPRHVGPGRR